MRFILVLQWTANSDADFGTIFEMEEALEKNLDEENGYIDGHDVGSGEMNLFVHTDQPVEAFEAARHILGASSGWDTVRAAYRPVDADDYTVVWPAGLQEFSVS